MWIKKKKARSTFDRARLLDCKHIIKRMSVKSYNENSLSRALIIIINQRTVLLKKSSDVAQNELHMRYQSNCKVYGFNL